MTDYAAMNTEQRRVAMRAAGISIEGRDKNKQIMCLDAYERQEFLRCGTNGAGKLVLGAV